MGAQKYSVKCQTWEDSFKRSYLTLYYQKYYDSSRKKRASALPLNLNGIAYHHQQ